MTEPILSTPGTTFSLSPISATCTSPTRGNSNFTDFPIAILAQIETEAASRSTLSYCQATAPTTD